MGLMGSSHCCFCICSGLLGGWKQWKGLNLVFVCDCFVVYVHVSASLLDELTDFYSSCSRFHD